MTRKIRLFLTIALAVMLTVVAVPRGSLAATCTAGTVNTFGCGGTISSSPGYGCTSVSGAQCAGNQLAALYRKSDCSCERKCSTSASCVVSSSTPTPGVACTPKGGSGYCSGITCCGGSAKTAVPGSSFICVCAETCVDNGLVADTMDKCCSKYGTVIFSGVDKGAYKCAQTPTSTPTPAAGCGNITNKPNGCECSTGPNCASGICVQGKCQAAAANCAITTNRQTGCDCTDNGQCQSNAYCDKGGFLGPLYKNQCAPKMAEGTTCDANYQCTSGLCDLYKCKRNTNSCTDWHNRPEGCECGAGASCASGICVQGKCQAVAVNCAVTSDRQTGCPCTDHGQCQSNAYCDKGGSLLYQNQCAPKMAEGTTCDANYQCTSGLCDLSEFKCKSNNNTCNAVNNRPNNCSCDFGWNCASGICNQGKCLAMATNCAITTNRQNGCSCTDHGQCQSSAYCDKGGFLGPLYKNQCAPKMAEGTTCDANYQCTSGLCDGFKCKSNNNTCNAVNNRPNNCSCDFGWNCASGICNQGKCLAMATNCAITTNRQNGCDCTDNGQCQSSAYCDKGGFLGPLYKNQCAPKMADGTTCDANYQCTSGLCDGFKCKSNNNTCNAVNNRPDGCDCGVGLSCASGVCVQGICQVPPTNCAITTNRQTGCSCTIDGQCQSSAYCDTGSSGPIDNPLYKNQCAPKMADGATCNQNKQCLNGVCEGGKCATPACATINNKPVGCGCLNRYNCASGVCIEGTCRAPATNCTVSTGRGDGCTCTEENQCKSSSYCDKGGGFWYVNQCAPKLTDGKTCNAPYQCLSGNCSGYKCVGGGGTTTTPTPTISCMQKGGVGYCSGITCCDGVKKIGVPGSDFMCSCGEITSTPTPTLIPGACVAGNVNTFGCGGKVSEEIAREYRCANPTNLGAQCPSGQLTTLKREANCKCSIVCGPKCGGGGDDSTPTPTKPVSAMCKQCPPTFGCYAELPAVTTCTVDSECNGGKCYKVATAIAPPPSGICVPQDIIRSSDKMLNLFKWFAPGYQMQNYLSVEDKYCSIPKPKFLGKTKGDANCDGKIEVADYTLWQTEFGVGDYGLVQKSTWESDFTGTSGVCDGKVDVNDYTLWQTNFNLFNSEQL